MNLLTHYYYRIKTYIQSYFSSSDEHEEINDVGIVVFKRGDEE